MSIANVPKPATVALTDTFAEIVPAPAAGKLHIVKSIQFTNVTTDDSDARVSAALKDGATVQSAMLHSCPITKAQNAISGLVDGDFPLPAGVSIVARAEAVDTAAVTVAYVEIDA